MNILKIKQYGKSSNQNLIMTRGKINKTFTSAVVLQFEKQITRYTLVNNSCKSFIELAPECSCSSKLWCLLYCQQESVSYFTVVLFVS